MNPKRYLVIKHRQALVSTFFLLYWLDDVIFTPNFTFGVLAHKWESLKTLFSIIRFAYESMPENVRPALVKDTETSYHFINGSRIFVSLQIRSAGLNGLHISEWCLCKDEDVIASLAAVGPQGHVTGESTAEGVGNHGYNTYQDGKLGLNRFTVRFLPWHSNEFYKIPLNGMNPPTPTEEELRLPVTLTPEQILYRRDAKKQYGHLFYQECAEDDDSCFLTTGGAYFNNRKIHVLFKSSKNWLLHNKPFIETDDYIGWEQPGMLHRYVAGADTAEGLKQGDYSVLKIICVKCGQEAFRYRARVGIDKFAEVCDHYCKMYNNALLAVERNNHGHAVLEWLKNAYHYPNLYLDTKITKVVGFDQKEPKYGWETTKVSKVKMLDMLRLGVEGNYDDDELHFEPEILWLDQVFLQECLTFVQAEGKLEAVEGKYDDSVMATAIAFRMYMNSSNDRKMSHIQNGNGDSTFGIFTGSPRESA